MKEEKLIHGYVHDPNNSIFKPKANDRALSTAIYCKNSEDCPFLKGGTCISLSFTCSCPYGRKVKQTGPTRRAKGFYSWIKKQEDAFKQKNAGILHGAPDKMVYLGEYVYLPYSFLNTNKAIPFETHGSLFVTGSKFLLKKLFTVDVVSAIVNHRPQAMMGGEITSYQLEEVPKFLSHLKEVDPVLYSEFAKINPERASKEINYVGRLAYIKTLPVGTNVVGFEWDGKTFTNHNYKSTLIKGLKTTKGKVTLSLEPTDEDVIKITSNDQVGSETRFLD